MTTLKDTKLGDRVKVWLNKEFGLSRTKTDVYGVEATVIGKTMTGTDYMVLGWASDQIHPRTRDMTVVPPPWMDRYAWVKNRLDYAWFYEDGVPDMECEILPPIQTQSVLPGVQSPTVKETKWVDATFKDVKLGDKVKVYLTKAGRGTNKKTGILSSEGTVIRVGSLKPSEFYQVVLGWNTNDGWPKNGERECVRHKQVLPSEVYPYEWCYGTDYGGKCQILQTIYAPAEPAIMDKEVQLEAYGRCMLGAEEAKEPTAKETGSAWIAAAIGAGAVAAGIANAMYKAPGVRVEGSLALPIVEAASEQMKASV